MERVRQSTREKPAVSAGGQQKGEKIERPRELEGCSGDFLKNDVLANTCQRGGVVAGDSAWKKPAKGKGDLEGHPNSGLADGGLDNAGSGKDVVVK